MLKLLVLHQLHVLNHYFFLHLKCMADFFSKLYLRYFSFSLRSKSGCWCIYEYLSVFNSSTARWVTVDEWRGGNYKVKKKVNKYIWIKTNQRLPLVFYSLLKKNQFMHSHGKLRVKIYNKLRIKCVNVHNITLATAG